MQDRGLCFKHGGADCMAHLHIWEHCDYTRSLGWLHLPRNCLGVLLPSQAAFEGFVHRNLSKILLGLEELGAKKMDLDFLALTKTMIN